MGLRLERYVRVEDVPVGDGIKPELAGASLRPASSDVRRRRRRGPRLRPGLGRDVRQRLDLQFRRCGVALLCSNVRPS